MLAQQYQSCIEACHGCDACAASCLKEQDVRMLVRCIALDIDCAELCRLAAAYMARESEFAYLICQACVDICEACADECTKHTTMSHCQEYAQACRRCAQATAVGRRASLGAGAAPN